MSTKTHIELNINFYTTISKEFTASRKSPWKGWTKILSRIKYDYSASSEISVLDLGCGNGRFYKYLLDKLKGTTIDYTGVDIVDNFLSECSHTYPTGNFLKLDLFNDLRKIAQTFDIVAVFGITHHFYSSAHLSKYIKQLIRKINPNGLLILSFWEPIKQTDVKINKVIYLDWSNKGLPRSYIKHDYPKVIKELDKIGLKLLDSYKEDHNLYLIFNKTN